MVSLTHLGLEVYTEMVSDHRLHHPKVVAAVQKLELTVVCADLGKQAYGTLWHTTKQQHIA